MNKLSKHIFSFILVMFISSFLPVKTYAQCETISEKAYDTYSKDHSHLFSHTKSYTSINPDVGTTGMPEKYKKVSFKVLLNATTQHDKITGKFVSASTPTATLRYTGPVNLSMNNVSTSKHDNGNSITFSYKANIVGVVDVGIPITINYGSVSDSFTVSK